MNGAPYTVVLTLNVRCQKISHGNEDFSFKRLLLTERRPTKYFYFFFNFVLLKMSWIRLSSSFTWWSSLVDSKMILLELLVCAGFVWMGIKSILYFLKIGWPFIALLQFLQAIVPLVGLRKGSAYLLMLIAGTEGRKKLLFTSSVNILLLFS